MQLLTYRGGGRTENKERGAEEAQKQQRSEMGMEKNMRVETTHSAEEGVAEKHTRTDSEMDTEAGGEAGTSHSLSWHKKGYMTNIYLTDSEEEAFVDLSRIMRRSTTRQMSTLRTRKGRNACGRGSVAATTCQ